MKQLFWKALLLALSFASYLFASGIALAQTANVRLLVSKNPFGDIALIVTDRPITPTLRDSIAGAVRAVGGHVSIAFPPDVIVGKIPAASHAQLLGRHGIRFMASGVVNARDLGVSDQNALAGVRFFNWVVSGDKAREEERVKNIDVHPSSLNEHLLRVSAPPSKAGILGQDLRRAHHTPFPNDVMDGWNTVDVFYVESVDDPNTPEDENEFTWSEPHYYDTTNRITAGFLWWVDIASLLNIQPALFFWMTHHSPWVWQQQVPFEPIRRNAWPFDFDWISRITANHGITGGNDSRTRARAYAASQRALYGSKNGWVAFVVYDPPGAPTQHPDGLTAYGWYGDYVHILYQVSSYPVEQTGWVFAHEIGHVFYACDEYSPVCGFYPNCTNCYQTGEGPRPASMNWNCELCTPGGPAACIMHAVNSNTWTWHATCQHTRAMIGWPY